MGEGVDACFCDGDVRLEGHGCVVDCSGDEDDAAAGTAGWGRFAVGFVGGGGLDEVREGGFEGVVGAENVDVHDGFEGVGAELGDGREEVAGCAGAERIFCQWLVLEVGLWGDIHYIVYPSKLLNALLNGLLQALDVPDINCTDAQHFCSRPGRSYILSHAFCFLDIASHYAGVGAKVDECSDLSTAD